MKRIKPRRNSRRCIIILSADLAVGITLPGLAFVVAYDRPHPAAGVPTGVRAFAGLGVTDELEQDSAVGELQHACGGRVVAGQRFARVDPRDAAVGRLGDVKGFVGAGLDVLDADQQFARPEADQA